MDRRLLPPLLVAVAACSSSQSPAGPTGSGPVSGDPAASSDASVRKAASTSTKGSVDGGHSTADASTDATDATDATPYDGADLGDAGPLVLEAIGGASGLVGAEVLLNEPGVGPEMTCSAPVDAGACQLTSCQLGPIGSPGGPFANFGTIFVSVGDMTEPLPYVQIGYPTIGFPPSVTLGEGQTMTFRGGGSEGVPAFDVVATIPGLGVITSPVPATDGGATVVDTSQDLNVTWTPIAIGHINFQIQSGPSLDDDTLARVTCTFEGTAGAGTVAQSLLMSLKAKSASLPTYGYLSSELDVSTVMNGLTIVMQSYQVTPPPTRDFAVTLE